MRKGLAAFLILFAFASFCIACGGGGTPVRSYKFSGGGAHSLFLYPDGRVFSCGYNGSGQLGIGNTDDKSVPTPVPSLTDLGVIAIAAGGFHSVALCSDGKVYTWGNNTYYQLGDGGTNNVNAPEELTYFVGKNIVAIFAGGYHSMALSSDGTCYAWGHNANSQLGTGDTEDVQTPAPITALSGSHVVACSLGWYHTLVLCDNGNVFSFGSNDYGQLGIGSTTPSGYPMPVAALTGLGVVSVAAGSNHSLALCSNGTVYAWGSNGSWELGITDGEDRDEPAEVTALAGLNISRIAAGWSYSAALTVGGALYTWGEGSSGQMGNGTTGSHNAVQRVTAFSDTVVIEFAACPFHMLAEVSGDAFYSWGDNKNGDLGTGDVSNHSTPQLITMP